MLVFDLVSAARGASSRRAAVQDTPCPPTVPTPCAPRIPARWLSGLAPHLLGMLIAMALVGSGGLRPIVPIAGRPARMHAILTVVDSLLPPEQQVLAQLRGAGLPVPLSDAAQVSLGARAGRPYRIYVPLARTVPQSVASAPIDLSQYPTNYATPNGYVYTGQRAQVLHHLREYFNTHVTTYASHADCPTCSADVWTPDARPGIDNSALPSMQALAEYIRAHSAALGIKYVIWNQHISLGGAWQEMDDRGSITANHKDHVHFTFADDF